MPDDIYKLTNLPSRILSFLLESAGRMVSKDEILENIWVSQGLQPSGSSLTQHLSQIRRILSELGIDSEFIFTIPKSGFIINENNVEIASESQVSPNRRMKKKTLQPIFSYPFFIAALSLTLIVVCFSYFFTRDNEIPKLVTNISQSSGECTIHYLSSEQMTYHSSFVKYINHIGGCSKDAVFFVNKDSKASTSSTGRIFISKCKIGKNSFEEKLYDCISYYQYQN